MASTLSDTCTWTGISGNKYGYTVYDPATTTWNDVPGNYIFAHQLSTGRWTADYIGETQSFKDRFSNHEKWPCAKRHGATHIHAHVNNGGQAARQAEESDLIASNNPPCNDQR